MRGRCSTGRGRAIFVAGIATCLSAQGVGATPFTPYHWSPRNFNAPWDENQNFVDDRIEAMKPDDLVDVIVCLNGCLSEEIRQALNKLAPVADGDVGVYLTTVVLHNVRVSDAIALPTHPVAGSRVAMVELDDDVLFFLDVSNPAIKVRDSNEYTPSTLERKYRDPNDGQPDITGAGVNIAVLDTGADDHLHESLPLAVAGFDALTGLPGNPVDGAPPPTNFGHGTHVASIALGRGGPGNPNAVGVAPAANLVDVRVLGRRTDVLRGLQWCIANRNNADFGGIQVVNMSLGMFMRTNGTDSLSELSNRTVEKCISVVVSMGNTIFPQGQLPDNFNFVPTPAAADDVITVAAAAYVPVGQLLGTISRQDDTLAFFSLTGPRLPGRQLGSGDRKPDVTAPGTNVNRLPMPGEPVGILGARHNTVDQYVRAMGTSMAAPHIAGLAALAIQANTSPARGRIPPLSVKKLILDNTTNDPANPPPAPFLPDPPQGQWNAGWGRGYVDAFRVIDACQPYEPLPPAGANTVQTDLKFGGLLMPAPTCCDAVAGPFCPDLFTSNPVIVAGVPNVINARVRNGGPNPASNIIVRIGFDVTGNNFGAFWLCERTIPNIPVGESRVVSCPWVPPVPVPPSPPVTHGCLKAEIIFPCDSDFRNNCAQHNVDIQLANFPQSPIQSVERTMVAGDNAVAPAKTRTPPTYRQTPFMITNPFEKDLQVVVEASCPSDSPPVYPSPAPPPPAPWTVQVLDENLQPLPQCFLMLPASCSKLIYFRIDPVSAQCGTVARNFHVWGLSADGACPTPDPGDKPVIYMGGGNLTVAVPSYRLLGGGSFRNGPQITNIRVEHSGPGNPNEPVNTFVGVPPFVGQFSVVDYASHKSYASVEVESISGNYASAAQGASFFVRIIADARINGDDNDMLKVELEFERVAGQLRYRLRNHATQQVLVGGVERPERASAHLQITTACAEAPCGN